MLAEETRTELFRLAFEYRKTKLWQRLFDSQLFGVTLADGEIGYCCVMGMRGEHVALGVYVGQDGMSSWYAMLDRQKYQDDNLSLALAVGQECLQCVFDDEEFCTREQIEEAETFAAALDVTLRGSFRYPHFERYCPAKFPSPIEDEAGADILMRCLRGAIRIAKATKPSTRKTGPSLKPLDLTPVFYPGDSIRILTEVRPNRFALTEGTLPERLPSVVPGPHPLDEFTVVRLKRCERAGVWDCAIFFMTNAKVEESPSCIPATTFVLPQGEKDLLPLFCVGDYDGDPDRIFRDFVDSMLRFNLRPEAIRVHESDLRGQRFFGVLANQLRIPFTTSARMPELNQALEDFENFNIHDDEIQERIGAICRLVNERSFDELLGLDYEAQIMVAALLHAEHPDITPTLLNKVRRLMNYWDLPY